MIEGDWSEWRNFILKELERQNSNIEALIERFSEYEKTCLQKEGDQKVINAEMRLKLYFIDMIFGAVGALIIIGIQWFISTL